MKSAHRRNCLCAERLLAVMATFAWAWMCSLPGASAVGVPAKENAKPRRPFVPEAETKFNEFVNRAAEARRKLWAVRMNREIEEVAKITELNEKGKEALRSPA